MTRDLTARSSRKQASRERAAVPQGLRSGADAILILDAESGTIVESNPQVSALFGSGQSRAVRKGAVGHLSVRGPADRGEQRRSSCRTRRVGGSPTWLRAKDGRKAFCEFVGTTYRVGDSVLIQSRNLRDITETRQLFQAKVEARALADINRRKDEFLAMLAHELRNPLAPIGDAGTSCVSVLRTGTGRHPPAPGPSDSSSDRRISSPDSWTTSSTSRGSPRDDPAAEDARRSAGDPHRGSRGRPCVP